MSVNAVRAALADRFETITGLRVHETFPSTLNPPAVFIGQVTRNPAQTFAAASTSTFEVFVCVSSVEQQRNVETLDDYADTTGSKSIEASLVADPKLGSTADSLELRQVVWPVTVEVGGVGYLGAQFTVEVFH